MVRDVDLSSPAVRFSAASLPNGRGFLQHRWCRRSGAGQCGVASWKWPELLTLGVLVVGTCGVPSAAEDRTGTSLFKTAQAARSSPNPVRRSAMQSKTTPRKPRQDT